MQFLTGLKAGDPGSTPALNAVPSIRAVATSVQSSRAVASGVGGVAPALHDISSISVSDLKRIIPIAIIAIGILFTRRRGRKGIKPIIGCEVYVAPGSRLEKKTGSGGARCLSSSRLAGQGRGRLQKSHQAHDRRASGGLLLQAAH